MNNYLKLLITLFLFLVAGCGEIGGDSSDDGTTPTPTPTPGTSTAVSAIQLSTSSSAIGTNQPATVSVTLFDASGQVVSETKTVTLTLDNPTLGSIPSPVTVSGGFTSQTFTARRDEGNVTITAGVDGVTAQRTIQISDQASATTVNLTANPASVTVNGTSVISATILDATGAPMPDGTTVNFSVNNPALGSIVATATTSGGQGIAQATFSAGSSQAGNAIVTATSGTASGTTTISVIGSAAGSIEFSSATPQIIVIQGAGGQETSSIQFLVKDSNGNPVIGSQQVRLVLSGPNGGEYIGPNAGITTLDVGTVNGFATTTLHSGNIPGTATITATVLGSNPPLTTSSGVIAIGGGVPSAGHFSLSADTLNLEGLAFDNITTQVQALIADRYGNFNVLEGTSVSFYSECGAVDRAVALNAQGAGNVTFRTQTPDPLDVSPGAGSCGPLCDFEDGVINSFETTFGIDITNFDNPRDGLCTIVAVVDGEEEFTDANADGLYNLGESFDDTYDDIHLDMDDDSTDIAAGAEIPGNPYDSTFEDLVVDRNENGIFDGKNDSWDSNKRITKRINLLITGTPIISTSVGSVNLADGTTQTISFSVHDENYNPPIAGTTFSVALSGGGTLTGKTNHTFLDTNIIGAPIFTVNISDANPGDSDPASVGALEISVVWKGGTFSSSIPVTID